MALSALELSDSDRAINIHLARDQRDTRQGAHEASALYAEETRCREETKETVPAEGDGRQ